MDIHRLIDQKRAFLNEMQFAREPLASIGLTVSRYQMLHVIFRCRDGAGAVQGVIQRELKGMLGVTASIVCRMVQALEQSGLVDRTPVARDGRQRFVALTPEGRRRVQLGQKALATTPGSSKSAQAGKKKSRARKSRQHGGDRKHPSLAKQATLEKSAP